VAILESTATGRSGRGAALVFRAFIAGAALGVGLAFAAPAEDFGAWLDGVRAEALGRGIRASTLDEALKGLQPIERVIELDRSQPEFTLTFQQYLDRVVPQARIDRGRQELAANRDLLKRVSERFKVPANFIVALWGVESNFGTRMGNFPVIGSLATLAYDGRRSEFFRKELLDALHILDERHIAPSLMLGSWAGAMGQNQFMPSSFRAFAVDFNGDGRRDIWTDRADVFASIANYLAKSGWRPELGWGRPVRLPAGFDRNLANGERRMKLSEWSRLGVRSASGETLPKRDVKAAMVMPDETGGPAFLVYSNYDAILKWNRSNYFATAVGLLADQIGE
jgi:membrane-bound lytic murein transglycosylase B